MKLLVNFATENFGGAQQFNTKTALKIGNFDRVLSTNPDLVDEQFKIQHEPILRQSRGAGYWLWKPYIIMQALDQLRDGDLLMYADAASHFIHSANPLLELPATYKQDIIPFELDLPESAWTKRDAFVYMNADAMGFQETRQFLASFIVIRKSAFSMRFMAEYLEYCCNPNILTDLDNLCGLPNYPGFTAHRHDQSVFSLLCKKYQLQGFRDPSQWGNSQASQFSNSSYPQIMEHTRQQSPKQAKLLFKLKRFMFPK
ncbi:hypothetical protein [Polynucleobacter sp. CS-Odin-A6]|uniref:hypothetical protein n=1 Tax=Polynucleobacter sp. CS-Odin-A6 TaxID=2689106 RepID=UPI001C0C67ED|nr:hypothetical protein [Polynucleobacter sp. CS-Odin-A6]MBU3621127.1 hypothetical protein [Polynucleobacter sp. CS-Odin-A6]